MTNFVDVTILAYVAVAINGILLLGAGVLLGGGFMTMKRQCIPSLNKMAATMPRVAECLNFAEVPIACTAIVCAHMQIPLEELTAEYAKDATQRKSIVVNTFRKDLVTDCFLNSFPSKFMKQGYAGEDRLIAPA